MGFWSDVDMEIRSRTEYKFKISYDYDKEDRNNFIVRNNQKNELW